MKKLATMNFSMLNVRETKFEYFFFLQQWTDFSRRKIFRLTLCNSLTRPPRGIRCVKRPFYLEENREPRNEIHQTIHNDEKQIITSAFSSFLFSSHRWNFSESNLSNVEKHHRRWIESLESRRWRSNNEQHFTWRNPEQMSNGIFDFNFLRWKHFLNGRIIRKREENRFSKFSDDFRFRFEESLSQNWRKNCYPFCWMSIDLHRSSRSSQQPLALRLVEYSEWHNAQWNFANQCNSSFCNIQPELSERFDKCCCLGK